LTGDSKFTEFLFSPYSEISYLVITHIFPFVVPHPRLPVLFCCSVILLTTASRIVLEQKETPV